MVKQITVNKSCASFRSRLQMCLENRGQSISRDLFRLNKIRLHVDPPEPRTASEDKILLRLLKAFDAK
jgi:hypothetical protein